MIQGKDHGFDGNLGLVIGAGGGSLTLTDAVRSQGGKPANYSEIGGNPSVAKACGLAKEVLEKDGVEKIAVMMSIVSNTRVDIVARGVIKACLELGKDPGETIAIFRIPGAWEDEGFKILEQVRRRVLRPLGLDVGGRRARRRQDPGSGRVRLPVSTPRGLKPAEVAVFGGVVGDFVLPAAPENPQPGAAEDADRVRVVEPAGAGSEVDLAAQGW